MSSLQPKQFRQERLFSPVGMYNPSPGPHGPAQVHAPSWESRAAVEPHQTRMLMPTREVINEVHKIDSDLYQEYDYSTPAQQWGELRPEKTSSEVSEGIARRDPIPPIRIQHPIGDGGHLDYEPELWNGHHRLAEFERAGHTEVPVWESFHDNEPDVLGGGGGYTVGKDQHSIADRHRLKGWQDD